MSEHKTLWAALLAFKAEAPALPKDKVNPHFKSRFTGLDTIADKIDPLLTKHGLVWAALPGHHEGHPTLDYRLAHATSGEVLSGSMPLLLDKENSQGLGSALTYSRRYAKTAVLDLVADEDDDGNAASRPSQRQQTNSPQPTAAPAQQTERIASAKQRGMLNAKAAEIDLAPSDFANLILTVSGAELRDFESQDHAQQWLKRALDRLPAAKVNPLLEQFARIKNDLLMSKEVSPT